MAFRFAQITDTHLYPPADRDAETAAGRGGFPDPERDRVYQTFLREVCAHDVDFIVHTGDLNTGGAGVERQRHFKRLNDEIVTETGIPIHYTRGNHDAFIGHRGIRLGDENYASVYGESTYWFAHKGWGMLVLDRYHRCYQHLPDYYDMNPATLDRLEELLQEIPPEMPLVLCLHENPIGVTRFHRGEVLLHRLRRHNLQLHLFGHVQNNYISRVEGVPYVTVVGEGASFDSAPLTYNLVTCRDDGTAVCDFLPHTSHIHVRPEAPSPATGGTARPAGDWTDLLGPRGTREATDPLPTTAPRLAWRAQTPGVLSVGAPTLLDGAVVVGVKTNGRFEQCQVRAHDAATGRARWVFQADASVEGGVLLADGRGYCGTTAGSVYCLDLADGSVVWQWNNRENLPIACEPTLDEGILHLGANWEMYGLDAATGETLWRNLACPQGVSYFCPGHAKPLIIGDRVYHHRTFGAAENPLLQSVDKRLGTDRQTCAPAVTNFPGQRQASPLLYDGTLVTAANGLLVFDPAAIETPLLHNPQPSASATPAIRDGVAYVSYHQAVRAHRLADGAVLWETPQEGALLQFSGGVRWETVETERRLPAGVYSAPLVSGDKLLVCDGGGHCRCLATADGTELWRISVGSPILSAPTVSGNTLYVGAYDGTLYAFAW
jgi:outer membrane protein assembly factor BamB